jgi:hypothetical protein
MTPLLAGFTLLRDFFYFNKNTTRVKQECPLSPTLFGVYFDKLDTHLREHAHANDGYLVHHVHVSLHLYANVVLLASSPKGLGRQLNAHANLCNHMQLMVNRSKTKVMIFNVSKNVLSILF